VDGHQPVAIDGLLERGALHRHVGVRERRRDTRIRAQALRERGAPGFEKQVARADARPAGKRGDDRREFIGAQQARQHGETRRVEVVRGDGLLHRGRIAGCAFPLRTHAAARLCR